MSRKSLENIDSTKKKDRLPKKLSRFAPSIFDNHAETLRKQYVILLLNFTKTDGSISGKIFSTAHKFPGKNLIKTDETQIWQSVEILLTKYDNILLKFWKNS